MTLALGATSGPAAAPSTVPASRPSSLITPAAKTASGALNYSALLTGDPVLQQDLAGINATGAANQAQLQAQQQRALIDYGQIPTGLPPGLAGMTDPVTRALAQQATNGGVSTVAQLAKQYQGGAAATNENLAARGMLRSGAYNARQNANLQAYNHAGYQASQALLDYLQGLQSGYLQQQDALRQQGVTAEQSALDRVVSQINAGTLAPPTVTTRGNAAPPPTYLAHGGAA